MLEDGAPGGGEPPAATVAAPLRDVGSDETVPPGVGAIAAAPLINGLSEQLELFGRQTRHDPPPKGFALPIWICPIRKDSIRRNWQ